MVLHRRSIGYTKHRNSGALRANAFMLGAFYLFDIRQDITSSREVLGGLLLSTTCPPSVEAASATPNRWGLRVFPQRRVASVLWKRGRWCGGVPLRSVCVVAVNLHLHTPGSVTFLEYTQRVLLCFLDACKLQRFFFPMGNVYSRSEIITTGPEVQVVFTNQLSAQCTCVPPTTKINPKTPPHATRRDGRTVHAAVYGPSETARNR